MTFVSTLNNTQALTVSTGSGAITFTGIVGGTTALGALTLNSTGVTTFSAAVSAASVTTNAGGSLKTIGRAPGVDFVVDAALVSRVHCRLTLSDANELLLEDLGSTNGTFVNGEKVPTAVLSDGDKVTVGRIEFVVNEA